LTSDLRDLYQEVILDHSKHPQNFREPADANRTAEGYNPLCGDQVKVYAKVEDNVIADLAFQGSGCAISKASASMMTTSLKGKTIVEAERIFEQFHHMVTGENGDRADTSKLGKLAVFSGVCEFPSRVKCASLAWHALRSALQGERKSVSTE
jgi:nitrogen fixation NifU-like protein